MSSAFVPPPPVARFLECRLADLVVSQPARVVAVLEAGALGERLMELGLTANAPIEVVRRGPFGDPMQVCIRGYMLSLRRAQAEAVRVRVAA